MFWILRWNDEYLDMGIVAGPLKHDDVKAALLEAVRNAVAKDYDCSLEMADKVIAMAALDLFNEKYDVNIYKAGASICVNGYEERYQIVEYEMPNIISGSQNPPA